MSCYLCQTDLKNEIISCSNCNQKFNLYCICNFLKKDNKCPKCRIDFIPNENICTLNDFKKIGMGKIQLILDTTDIIIKNMDNKINQKNKIIENFKINKKKYKKINIVLISILFVLFYYLILKFNNLKKQI